MYQTLASNNWYDASGNPVKSVGAGASKTHTKTEYDGLGRATKMYVGYDTSETSYADAGTVSGDTIVEQSEMTYDAASSVIQTTSLQRKHDATGTGALTSGTNPKGRTTYSTSWYDALGRTVASADYGTYGGSSFTRSATVPSRSDTILVSGMEYDDAGQAYKSLDPKAIESRSVFDAKGRATKTIEAYDDGDPATGNADRDRTTEYTYNADGQVKTMTARMSSTNYQTTEYVYGVTTSSSDLNSLALLASVKYPDPTTGAASGASGTVETFTYDRTGKRKKYTDRNGSVHEYSFDKLGRLTNDAVTTLATGVNGDIRRLVYAYDVKGRLDTASSYDAATGGTLKNQVKRAYNDLGQLFKEYQAHSGAVNTGTTPFVGYAYSEMPGGANHSRPVSMTYPNGRILRYEYSSGTDAELNRLSFLADDSSGSVGTHLEEYTYLGASTVVTRAHPQPGVDLTYVKQGSESATDGGDDYTGIDRFGRVIDQRWLKTSGGTHVDRFKYGYDRNSSRLYKENVVQASNSELYHANGSSAGYDTLNRLIDFRRGTLSDSNSDTVPDTVSTATRTQAWTLDALGNWPALNTDGTSVSRTHDKHNRLTAVASTSLTFDDNGNLRTDNTTTWTNTYDAWSRRVRQAPPTGARHIVTYAFDALGRRIKRTNNGATLAFYYTAGWQVAQDGSGATFVWSPVYVDAVVARDRNTDANASTGSYGWGADERLYATADANFNVTALTDASGAATERFQYDPYGNPSFLTGSWAADADGFSDAFWPLLHQGGWYDNVGATGPSFYHFRNRDYSPTLGRWVQQDPLEYVDGLNLYQLVGSNPVVKVDPMGQGPSPNSMAAAAQKRRWYAARLKEVTEALKGLCPVENNENKCGCSAADCQQQANEIARAIVDVIARERSRTPQFFGGTLGNYAGGNQCGDWQQVTEKASKNALSAHRKQCFEVTELNATSTVWWPAVDWTGSGNFMWRTNYHNWTELTVCGGMPVVIDPWPTAGNKIVDPSYTGGWDKIIKK